LLLRGQRDFESQTHYAQFLRTILAGRNRGRQATLQEELPHMHTLPALRLEDFRVLRVMVNRFSMIRVGHNVYSVASRLIGETVAVRLYSERLEVRHAGDALATIDRRRGQASIDYRHLIGALVHKPGAFARYRYQATLVPTTTFRQAYDALILDDLGYVQQDREEMEVLFTLLAERYERRSVLITSNLVFSKWDQIFKDPMTTAAAVDRVVHHAVILELPIPSYRAQAAKARSQAPSGAATPDIKSVGDTAVNDERTDGTRTAP
jgi:hypothetical protein